MFHNLPLFNAHKRIRMRPARFYPVVFGNVVVILALATLFTYFDVEKSTSFQILVTLSLIAQYVSLAIMGSYAVNDGIRQDLGSGLLSFHRLTPMSPDNIIWGYISGLASGAFVIWSIWMLAGAIFCTIGQLSFPNFKINLGQYFQVSLMIIACSCFFYLSSFLTTMITPQNWEKSRHNSIGSTLPIILLFIPFDTRFLTPIPFAAEVFKLDLRLSLSRPHFFNMELEAGAYSLYLLVVLSILVYIAIRRKIIWENRSLLSKKHAVVIMAVLYFTIIGRTYSVYLDAVSRSVLFTSWIAFSLLSLAMVFAVIPKRLLLRQYLVRIIEGKRLASWWHDSSPALPAAFLLFSLAVLAHFVTYNINPSFTGNWDHNTIMRCVHLAALVIFTVGLVEGSRLSFSQNTSLMVMIVCGLWWFLPLIFLSMEEGIEIRKFLLGVSPWYGFTIGFPGFKDLETTAKISIGTSVVAAFVVQFMHYSGKQTLIAAIKRGERR